MIELKGDDVGNEPVQREGGARRHRQHVTRTTDLAADRARRRRDPVQGAADEDEIDLARLGQCELRLRPIAYEQRRAEPALKGTNALSDRGRCHTQLLRSAGEAQVSRRGFEGAKGIQRRQSAHGIPSTPAPPLPSLIVHCPLSGVQPTVRRKATPLLIIFRFVRAEIARSRSSVSRSLAPPSP
jgi:hypothetical protein